MICKQCGTVHDGKQHLPGNGWIEAVLWLAYIFPGLIYSIWRRSARKPTCGACGSRDLVPLSSPVGKSLQAQFYPDGLPLPKSPEPRRMNSFERAVDRTARVLLWALGAVLAAGFLVSWFFSGRG